MIHKNITTRFTRNLMLTSLLFCLFALFFVIYVSAEKRIGKFYDMRHLSYQLADELRQSSDDLTRMVRTYVITGDPKYKLQYQAVLDIRNGRKTRPEEYSRIHWDLVLMDGTTPRPDTTKSIALLELMRQNGFSEEELAKLSDAKGKSDRLADMELDAMKLVDATGPGSETGRARALIMIHDERYHQAKAAIMKPIDDFYELVDKRTKDAVYTAKGQALALQYVLIVLALGLMFMLWRTYRALFDTLGGSLDMVYAQIARIGQGDFSSPITVHDRKSPSVIGWLAETQAELLAIDREKEKLQSQLLHTQKMESVGQLAAGIAHEINTPTQYISTNINFLEEAFKQVVALIAAYDRLLTAEKNRSVTPALIQEIEEALDNADWEYLVQELPQAIAQSKDGVRQVASIVGAMKEFSHPGGRGKTLLSLNELINTTLIVSRNEWKYLADLETNFTENLPQVACLSNEIGQVFLNLLVNSAHAIATQLEQNPNGPKGRISISTRQVVDQVEIRIQDTGCGIPGNILNKVFDPFFTTKEVGKGTGQGLAIARDVIVNKHGGTLEVESEPGQGATFIINLPIAPIKK